MPAGGRQEHFLPIEDYGVIGNLHTIALVSRQDASIDHFCFPHFDSPLLFGRLLTRTGGGYFEIAPAERAAGWTAKQLYLPSSNVLVTRFLGAAGGIGQVTDFLPVTAEKCWPWVVRKVETVRGALPFRLHCQPAFDYGRVSHRVRVADGGAGATFASAALSLDLCAVVQHAAGLSEPVPLCWRVLPEHIVHATGLAVSLPRAECVFALQEGQAVYFVLKESGSGVDNGNVESCALPRALLARTNAFWHEWLSRCTYRGRWREMVQRSALVLKLMTFAPTGAIIAAPTTSLPEQIGGAQNWDYRFTWIRDAAFTVYAFLRIGLTDEAAAFMGWVEARCRDLSPADPAGLRLVYDIHGRHPTVAPGGAGSVLGAEEHLEHWTGYRDSRPVRIGNLAAHQHQLDIYGELLDAIYLCDKWVRPISYDFWLVLRDQIVPHVVRRWEEPDNGIWETRDAPRHHVYSKVMAWVALDRVLRLAHKRSFPAPRDAWISCRDCIYESVMQHGYNADMGVFTRTYASDALDAGNLIMPLVFFLPPDDPRFLRTLERTRRPPSLGGLAVNSLLFRYHPPSAGECEGTFTICSFWLVEALARAGVRSADLLADARLLFEDLIGYASHVGLFSEEIGLDGAALGNFPQAFTHLSLISAAFNLDRALG